MVQMDNTKDFSLSHTMTVDHEKKNLKNIRDNIYLHCPQKKHLFEKKLKY